MIDADFRQLDELQAKGGSNAVFDWLCQTLRERQEFHKLFDVRMIRKKMSLGLVVSRPTTLEDVPAEHRKDVEAAYVDAAREAGELFLRDGDIPAAWMYLQVIREPEKVREAIDRLPIRNENDEAQEEIMRLALFERVHPVKGVQMMLHTHGMCNTITSLDQVMPGLNFEQRRACAQVMVRELYSELRETVLRHVQQRIPTLAPSVSLKELVMARPWIFEGGNYHTDVSHLNSVVRFARSLAPECEEMKLALELCDYGRQLDEPLRYPGEPPFEDFYEAHRHFFQILLDQDRPTSLGYFREKLAAEPDERDRPILAYVLVDLLTRVGQLDEAVDVAAEYLAGLGDDAAFSVAELCARANRFDRLKQISRTKEDLVGYAAALIQEQKGRSD
jgi:hypothetical protein